ncbi:MAG: DNA repair exonuclease [archaeon]
MKIAIFSDFHLGFGARTERREEAFNNAKQAVELAKEIKPDLILHAGDLFDSTIPSSESLYEAIELCHLLKEGKSKVKILKENKPIPFEGIPVIAISGTHEYRGKDYKNALQLLEKAGCLIYLHASTAVIEKEGEKIAVHGLSGIPERKALDVLKLWNPSPLKEAKNILLFHQSIKEFLPSDDPMNVTISLEDLPKEFDYFIDGHLHWFNETELEKGALLIPGSTIITQMKKLESEKEKGIILLDTSSNKTEFIPLKNQRKLFYEKLSFENSSLEEVREKARAKIEEFMKENKQELIPLIRLKLVGTLSKGVNPSDLELTELIKGFEGKAIFSIEKDFSMISFKKKIKELRELQKSKQSITLLGINLLEKNLEATSFNKAFDVKHVFDLLAENETEKAMELLSEPKKGEKETENNENTAFEKISSIKKEEPKLSDYI